VGVSVGGNQTVVGVAVFVTVGVAETNGISVSTGKHADRNSRAKQEKSLFISVET